MAENPVEIPQAMREQAEQNIKQAHAAYEQLTDFVTKAMDAWMGAMPANPMVAGFKEVQGRAAEIAMENAESAFTFAGKMSNVRTPQDIVTLQTQLVQDRMQAFATQTQQLFSVIEEAIQKSKRGAMGTGMGAMPSIPIIAGFKDVQD
ncbi:MAG: phasin family protein, partial [Rhodomicrobium sp.]